MKTTYPLLLLLVCFVFYGCTSLDHVEPMKGNIEGNVDLGSRQEPFLTDYSGISVRLEGIDPPVEVQTDKRGHWVMKDIPAGTYNITYSKPGFNSYKQFGVEHVGGNISSFPYVNVPVTLFPITSVKVLSFVPKGFTEFNTYYRFTGTIADEPGTQRIIFFISNKGDASPTNYDRAVFSSVLEGTSFQFDLQIGYYEQFFGYKKGDVVSVKAYGSAFSNGTSDYQYYDPNFDVIIYPNISESGIEAKFTMP